MKAEVRYIDLTVSGIPPSPQVVMDANLDVSICVGLDCDLQGMSTKLLPPVSRGLMGLKWQKVN